jgi:two-component system, OmpR family, phosphate regulon sensor histidine kinase PhoR
MPTNNKPEKGGSTGLPLLPFGLVAVYIVLQFVWWAWLLITKDREISALQQQLLQEGVNPLFPLRAPEKTLWMVAGEGGVFLLLILFALWIIFRTARHELFLARQQRDFLLAASHELRTPIAGLKLHLQTLQRPDLPHEKREKLYATARMEADRLHVLTEKVLLATRLDGTHVPLEKKPMDAAAILRSVCSLGEATYASAHRLQCTAPKELVVQSDPEAFRSIAENLVENACKYSQAGSLVEVVLKRSKDRIELVVQDEGIGVPSPERSMIFRKFHRGGQEETRGTKGTGLGLYIVSRLVHALHGRVEHRPRIPQGSIFAATFPTP